MYEAFYGFRESPFRVTPDPRFLYRNPAIDEAVAALTYGIERRKGFLSLVGEVGTGKTTLLRHLLDSLPATTQTVFILYPTVQFDEMLEHILHELGIPTDGAGKFAKLQRLHEFLLEHTRGGGNAAILIDEAQDLDARVLEELRLLSNLETGTEKILQIVLAGQPELERKLAQPALRQLRQRIALHVRLRTLAPAEVGAYVRSRLERAGAPDVSMFTPDALARIAEVTEGIPRLVNVLCDAVSGRRLRHRIEADHAARSSTRRGPTTPRSPRRTSRRRRRSWTRRSRSHRPTYRRRRSSHRSSPTRSLRTRNRRPPIPRPTPPSSTSRWRTARHPPVAACASPHGSSPPARSPWPPPCGPPGRGSWRWFADPANG